MVMQMVMLYLMEIELYGVLSRNTGSPSYAVLCGYVNQKDCNKENLHTFFFFHLKIFQALEISVDYVSGQSVSITASKY